MIFSMNAAYKYCRVAFVLLLFVPSLFGEGYTFIKKKGIPDRLIPQDCPAGKVPEAIELTPTQAHMYALQKEGSKEYISTKGCDSCGGCYKRLSWIDSSKGKKFASEIKSSLDIIEQILKNEHRYLQTHYMFYHGQNGCFRFLQDFLNELYALLQIKDEFSDFKFFRVWSDAVPVADVNEFLWHEQTNIKNNSFHDTSERLQKKLLSVNLSLFGNRDNYGSYTFGYFKNNSNATAFDLNWIIESIKKVLGFDLTSKERTLLKTLVGKVSSDGSLFQICIPREKVDKCVYLCVPGGRPYDKKLVHSCYDTSKKRHVGISDILDAYIKPGFLKNFSRLDSLQARILISQDIMLNPESGVKFFRFTHTNNQDAYQEGLTQFVHHLAMRYLVETNFSAKKNMPLDRIAKIILNQKF